MRRLALVCLLTPAAACFLACGGSTRTTETWGHAALTLAAFKAQAPKEAKAVRARVKFEYHLDDKGERFQAGLTSLHDDPPASVTLHADRKDDEGRRLYELLKGGEQRPMILELRAGGEWHAVLVKVIEAP
jgi:hypothetical protein